MPELDHLLLAFRTVVPTAAGVVLATREGRALASDVEGADALVREAGATWGRGESVLVPREAGPVLVVFLDSTLLPQTATAAA